MLPFATLGNEFPVYLEKMLKRIDQQNPGFMEILSQYDSDVCILSQIFAIYVVSSKNITRMNILSRIYEDVMCDGKPNKGANLNVFIYQSKSWSFEPPTYLTPLEVKLTPDAVWNILYLEPDEYQKVIDNE